MKSPVPLKDSPLPQAVCPKQHLLSMKKDDMVTKEAVEKEPTKKPEVENVKKEPESASRPIPITIFQFLPHEQPESPQVTLKPDRGKGKVTDDVESSPKLVKASLKIRPAPDEPVR
ncbi:hypothetical protein Tco_0338782, partial [Tanacetum coccineum]